jgi:diguanylate cyclase (GGDEF)-like protein
MTPHPPHARPLLVCSTIAFASGGLVTALGGAVPLPMAVRAVLGGLAVAALATPLIARFALRPVRRAAAEARRVADEQRARALAAAERLLNVDPLTGLLNRRGVEARIAQLLAAGVPFSLAMADLDGFKLLNDTHGHAVGDRALRLFAHTLAASVRPGDEAARFGGEEFVVLLPNADADAATAVLERVRGALRRALADADVPPFTSSFGVADRCCNATADEILEHADRALYAAKRAGRDRVVVFTAGTPLVSACHAPSSSLPAQPGTPSTRSAT